MSDTFLAPDDLELAFPSVDHSLCKPLWLVGMNFFPKKLVFVTEWSSPEVTGAFGQWIKLYTGISYLAKQGFNFGPKRGYYILEMANQDLVATHTHKLHVSSSPSDRLILPEAKSTLMAGTFLGPTGMPFIQSPIHGGRKAKWGGGSAASVGLVLQLVASELASESWLLSRLIDEFTSYCEHERSPLEELEASHAVPFGFTEMVTTVEWTEIAVNSGVVPESMFDDPPEETEAPLSTYVEDRDAGEDSSTASLIPDLRAEFVRDGELDLRGLFDWTFEDPSSESEALILDYTLRSGRTLDDLYEKEFKKHWAERDRAGREAELVKLIRFHNAMSISDYEPGEEITEFDLILASLSAKVFMFTLATDATYETDYLTALTTDPLVFGVHEIGERDSDD